MFRPILACLVAVLAMSGAASAGGGEATETLLDRLTAGGYVIYWRHATTDRSQGDRDLRDMDRCELQRNLNEQGRAEAKAVGRAFAVRGIPVGPVLTSHFCRNRETAELAFGRYERVDDLWNLPSAHAGPLGRDALVSRLRARLGEPPEDPATNIVIVGHNLNLQAAARVVIGEGGIAVFRPLGGGRFELQGTLTPADFR